MQTYSYLGIDVSKDQLDYALLVEGSWQYGQFQNEIAAIRDWLLAYQGPSLCLVLEPTGVYHDKLIHLASELAFAFVLVNPRKSYHFIQAQGHLHRNDRQTARSLAQMGAEKQLQPTQFSEEMKRRKQRKQLQMALSALLKQQRMLKNQLHALAQLYQPNSKALSALETTLATLEEQVEQLKQELKPEPGEEEAQLAQLIGSVIGIGPQSVECFLTYLGDFSQFESHKQVLKFAGVVPAQHTSGSSVRKKSGISKKGPPMLRATLYMAARAAKKHNLACKELYLRLRKKGKPHKVAMIAVVAKLIKQVFAVVKSGVPFDNQYYLKYKLN